MDPSYSTQARVVVTRPVAQSDRLSSLVKAAGGTALRIPALEIRSTDNPDAAEAVFARIDEFQTVLFISPNAVRHSLQFIGADALSHHRCMAIGASTAQAMTQAGIECHAHPKDNFTSEALLELDELQDVSDENILIIRGNGGRALLGNELTQRGANITYAEVYRRQIPEESAQQLNTLLAQNGADMIIANSGETLANIVSMVDAEHQNALFDLLVVTGSARVAQAATTAGFKRKPLIADTPDDHALMNAIHHWSRTQNDADDTTDTATQESDGPEAPDSNESEENPMTEESKIEPTLNDDDAQFDRDTADADTAEANTADELMADTDIQPEHTPVQAAVAAPPAPAKRGGTALALLALLTAALAAAGTAYNWLQLRNAPEPPEAFDVASLNLPSRDDIETQIRDASQSQAGRVNRELQKYGDTLNDVQSEQSTLASQVRSQKRSVENLTDELTQMSDSISAMRGVSASVRNTWVRAETEYFLQTANTRLQLAGDVKSAIQALKAADERIVALGDPSLTPVRAQVSEELLALESLPDIDLEGIALSLNSLAASVSDLPLLDNTPTTFVADEPAAATADPEAGAWDKIKVAFGETVGGFVRVSPTEGGGAAFMAPEQAFFLYRNLELQLQAARIAALQGQQSIYDDSLASCKDWLETFFDIEDNAVKTLLSRINTLQQARITQELPDISRSLNLIRAVVPINRTSGPGASPATPATSEEPES